MPSLRPKGSGHWLIVFCAALTLAAAMPAVAASPEGYRLNEAAVLLTAEGRYEEAVRVFTQALRLSPGDEVIRRNLARVHTVLGHRRLQAGLFPAAREHYLAAVDLVPDEPAALLGLGESQLRQREPRAAAESFRRVIQLEPRSLEAYLRLGESYYALGDPEAALSEWERALALGPEDVRVRQRVEAVRREVRVQSGYRSRDSQHFTLIYEGQRNEDLGRELLQVLERAYADVGYELGAYPPNEIPVICYSEVDFTSATGFSSRVGGFYHRLDGKIRIPLRGVAPANPQLNAILAHEYTHALIYAITRGNNPPRWMHEGLAVHMEKWRAAEFKHEAVQQARAGRIPSLDSSPHVHGSVAVEYLIERYGMAGVQQLLRRMGEGVPFADAFQDAFRIDPATFQQGIRDVLVRGY